MRVVNKEVVAETALDMDYETCYFKIDDRRWYSTTHTTRVQEIRHRGRPDDDPQISFIQILEGLLLRLALYFPHNRLRGILWRSVY